MPDTKNAFPTSSVASVTVILVTYWTGPVLEDSLAAILSDPLTTRLVIVDNGNPPDVRAMLSRLSETEPRVLLKTPPNNVGFAKGCNLGAREALDGLVVFINPDAVLAAGSLAALLDGVGGQPEPVLIGGKLIGLDGQEQRGGRRDMLTLKRAAITFFGLSRFERLVPQLRGLHRNTDPEPDGCVEIPCVSGAFMAMSRVGFEHMGGFDEGYPLHVEDIDLCRRVHSEGGKVLYTPHASVLHHGSTSKVSRLIVEAKKAHGLARYFRRHAHNLPERILGELVSPVFAAALIGRTMLANTRNWVRDRLPRG
jgi:GT2 family glycosyltransferase